MATSQGFDNNISRNRGFDKQLSLNLSRDSGACAALGNTLQRLDCKAVTATLSHHGDLSLLAFKVHLQAIYRHIKSDVSLENSAAVLKAAFPGYFDTEVDDTLITHVPHVSKAVAKKAKAERARSTSRDRLSTFAVPSPFQHLGKRKASQPLIPHSAKKAETTFGAMSVPAHPIVPAVNVVPVKRAPLPDPFDDPKSAFGSDFDLTYGFDGPPDPIESVSALPKVLTRTSDHRVELARLCLEKAKTIGRRLDDSTRPFFKPPHNPTQCCICKHIYSEYGGRSTNASDYNRNVAWLHRTLLSRWRKARNV